jgi:succinate dehydrogenase/fumarate reductase flavoprotein subunit
METSESPVVVIGTGGAGLRAALELRRAGVPVVILSKGAAGASGATPSGLYSYCVGRPGDPANPPDLFYQDVLRSGLTVNDPSMVGFLCQDGYARLEDLLHLGMPWARSADGEITRGSLQGHSAPRAFSVDRRTGQAMSTALLRACLQAGASFLQYHAVLDFIVDRGALRGLAVLDWVNGQAAVWECDTVILATGGAPGIYRLHTNPPGQSGDGMALILRAGGELVDMEFMQMYPTVLVHPPAAMGMDLPSGLLLRAGARLVNRRGEEFFHRWEKGPVGRATRDVLARAIAREIAAGGGTNSGGVILDSTPIPQEFENDRYVRFLRELGVDPAMEPQQVAPGAHYSLGGVRVRPPTACVGISGIFAAGEVAGGVHGANRLAGNALPETQVFGALAGQEALAFLRNRGGSGEEKGLKLNPAPAGRPIERGECPLWDTVNEARSRSSGSSVGDLEGKLRDLMQEYAAVIRTAAGLENALIDLEGLRSAFNDHLCLPQRRERWHPEWLSAVEVGNMLEVSRALLASALIRTESRGAHYRDDHPDLKEEWNGHNLIVQGQGPKMSVFRLHRGSNERRKVWP